MKEFKLEIPEECGPETVQDLRDGLERLKAHLEEFTPLIPSHVILAIDCDGDQTEEQSTCVSVLVDKQTEEFACYYLFKRDGSAVRTEGKPGVASIEYDGENGWFDAGMDLTKYLESFFQRFADFSSFDCN